jgi:hypothetical protein
MILVGRPKGRRRLGIRRRRWDDNIKMEIQEVGGGMDWIDIAQHRDRWRALVHIIIQNNQECHHQTLYVLFPNSCSQGTRSHNPTNP